MKPIFALLVLLSVAACAGRSVKNTVANSHELKPGLVEWQVQDILGAPVEKQTRGDEQVWFYDLYADNNRAVPYMVVFKSGLTVAAYVDQYSEDKRAQTQAQRQEALQQWAHSPDAPNALAPAPTTTCQSIPNGFGGFTTKCR